MRDALSILAVSALHQLARAHVRRLRSSLSPPSPPSPPAAPAACRYGFHTNLPSTGLLNPLAWLRMAVALFRLPRFDPLDLVLNSKSVHGFNLSFFADEAKLLEAYMDQARAHAVSWSHAQLDALLTLAARRCRHAPHARPRPTLPSIWTPVRSLRGRARASSCCPS